MEQIACMFPGQGSQVVGMGKDLYDHSDEVKQLFDTANHVLNKNIKEIMFNGPKEILTETENTQPALLLTSIAAYSLFEKEGIRPVMTVGHSLGEYSALVAANALQIEEALPLVASRGRLMEEAVPKGQGTMAAVLGLNEEEVVQAIKNGDVEEIVDVANLNCPGQIVISGTKAGVEHAIAVLKEAGARRVIPLNVSGPFHSRLMEPASVAFEPYVDQVSINDATIPVYANVTAEAVTDKNDIKKLLLKQLYSPVRFEQSIRHMMDQEVDAFVEVGTGNVLCGLVRKINRKVKTFSVQDHASFMEFLSWYKEGE